MRLHDIFAQMRKRIERQRRYRQTVDEINALSNRDLLDMRTNRDDMLRWARADILG